MVRLTYGDSLDDRLDAERRDRSRRQRHDRHSARRRSASWSRRSSAAAIVNCWVTRRLARGRSRQPADDADLRGLAAAGQRRRRNPCSAASGSTSPAAPGGRTPVANGAKGGEGWSSCGSCHPDGLTDNITWIFGSGRARPRRWTARSRTAPAAQKQRMLNWTAINDELHDFEPNIARRLGRPRRDHHRGRR